MATIRDEIDTLCQSAYGEYFVAMLTRNKGWSVAAPKTAAVTAATVVAAATASANAAAAAAAIATADTAYMNAHFEEGSSPTKPRVDSTTNPVQILPRNPPSNAQETLPLTSSNNVDNDLSHSGQTASSSSSSSIIHHHHHHHHHQRTTRQRNLSTHLFEHRGY